MWFIGYIKDEVKQDDPYFTRTEIDNFKTLSNKEKNILREMCGYEKKHEVKVVKPTYININYFIW